MKKAIVLAGSRGIGKGIADALREINFDVLATSSADLDTSNLLQVEEFGRAHRETDVLVLNTGGPPAKNFWEILDEDWEKYHNQLFLSFCKIIQNVHVRDGGYIFLISSFNIKEPDEKLILSNCYRIAFSSVLKSLSKTFAHRHVSCINIAPGPILTDRLESLVVDMEEFSKTLPMGRPGKIEEIGGFVKGIVENDVKYLTGVTINFDGGASNYIL
tara:strand:- start:3819 stop:4466 length:648 start_codon:yes stop_codon:yes gene_type:complete